MNTRAAWYLQRRLAPSAQVLQNLLHAALSPFSGSAIGMMERMAFMASVASLTGFSSHCKQ
jgi:hypothetical protein